MSLAQAILDAIGASASAGSEAVAAAERHIDLLTARAGSRDPSAVPTICRISAALHYTPGTKKYNFQPLEELLSTCRHISHELWRYTVTMT